MGDSGNMLADAITEAANRIIAHTDELTALDQAIGDGDHGANMKRGFEEVLNKLDELGEKPVGDALKAGGTTLVMKVGGASGPLYGTLFMAMGKELAGKNVDAGTVIQAFGSAIQAVMARGKSQAGQKTMLDVLVPVHAYLEANGTDDLNAIRTAAMEAAEATVPMLATKGRASFLGERSIGHMDPGARSSSLIIAAICDSLENAK